MSSKELDLNSWRHALAPWTQPKEGADAKLYTYLLPPGIGCLPGDTIMVEGPKGGAKFLTVHDVTEHTPTLFQCKPVALVIPQAEWQAAQEEYNGKVTDAIEQGASAEDIRQIGDRHRASWSMHEDYPKWKAAAADLFVEGR